MENSVIYAIGLLIAKEVISAVVEYFKNKNKSESELKIAVVRLTHDVERLSEKIDDLLRLKGDVNNLWAKLRDSTPPQG
jgi:hypothetical protein